MKRETKETIWFFLFSISLLSASLAKCEQAKHIKTNANNKPAKQMELSTLGDK